MEKWNLIVDVADCIGCNLCALACQDEFVGNEHPGYAAAMPKHGHRWIDIRQKVRGQAPVIDVAYLPVMCQHCDDAPCIEAAENDAVKKRDDGIVLIDPELAKGQKQLVDACPYGAIWWNEERQLPQHWFFDAHLLDDGWKEPRAVQVCPTSALRSVKIDDSAFARIVDEEGLEELNPEYGTRPRVWYKNLHRFGRCFVAGSVSIEEHGVIDCAEGVKVALYRDADLLQESHTDAFGDFKLDDLEENSGTYTLRIERDQEFVKELSVDLLDSVYLGEIRLT